MFENVEDFDLDGGCNDIDFEGKTTLLMPTLFAHVILIHNFNVSLSLSLF